MNIGSYKTIRTENSICRLGELFSEMLINGRCGLFECDGFRRDICRKNLLTAFIISGKSSEISQTWLDSSEYIIHLKNFGDESDLGFIRFFDELNDVWDNSDRELQCSFEKEMLVLKEKVMSYIKGRYL